MMDEVEALKALLREGLDVVACEAPYPWCSDWSAKVRTALNEPKPEPSVRWMSSPDGLTLTRIESIPGPMWRWK